MNKDGKTSKADKTMVSNSVRDFTFKMEADEQIVYMTKIIDNVSDAVFTFDENSIVTSWNKSAEHLYGWKASEIIGKNSAIVLRSKASPEELKERLKTIVEKGELLTEAIHFTKDNRKIIVEANVISVKDESGNVTGYLTVNRDITKRKQIEEQLRNEKNRLEILADLVSIFAKVTYDYNDALNFTVKKLANEIGDQCVIRILNDKGDRLVERAFWHRDKEVQEFLLELYSENIYHSDESFSGETIKSAKPLLISEITDTYGMKPEYMSYFEKFGLASILFVPIEAEGKILGTISMYRNKQGKPYKMDDQLFLMNVAGKIGFAITKANLFSNKLKEIEERKAIESDLVVQKNLLQKSETNFRELAESIKDVFFAMDKDLRYTYWNKASEKVTGIPATVAIGRGLYEIFPNIKGDISERMYLKVLKCKEPEWFINEFTVNGENFIFEISVYPSGDGLTIISKDITELRRISDENKATEKRYQNILDNMVEGCAILDYNWNYIYVNSVNAIHAHLSPEKMLGQNMLELIPGVEKTVFFETYYRCMKERVPLNAEGSFSFPDGSKQWYEARALPIPEGIFVLSIDITERKRIEEQIKSALREKEILIRELYHRTKNNMQVVYSLLGLKGATVDDENTRTILEDMGNRIQTIAMVHQKLYQSQNLSRIDLKEYITDLANLLMESYKSKDRHIKLALNLESVAVLIDTAIPCGMIINELISNSLKHAFPEGRDGVICIDLSKPGADIIEITISDNGIGIADPDNVLERNTLGLQLFRNIAEDQLQGEVIFNTENGVSCTVRFKDALYEARV